MLSNLLSVVSVGVLLLGGVLGYTQVSSFGPKSNPKTYSTSINYNARTSPNSGSDTVDVAKQFVWTQLGFDTKNYIIKNVHRSHSTGITHVYLRQRIDGREVFNGNINLNINSTNHVVSYGDSFYRHPAVKARVRSMQFPIHHRPATESMKSLLRHLNVSNPQPQLAAPQDYAGGSLVLSNVAGTLQDPKAQQGWLVLDNNQLEPVWDLQVEFARDYYHAHVSATSNKPVNLINWSSNAAYNVFQFRINDPKEGVRSLVVDPQSKEASPLGWHDTGDGKKHTDTMGNNVVAVTVSPEDPEELDAKSRVDGGSGLVFDFPFEDTKESPLNYKQAAITQLFYMNNMIHDLYYQYGFDEKAGNFQHNNFGKGGKGGDAIIAHGQDASGMNNAFFTSPPDGESGRMQMFLFDESLPVRDGDFDSGIVIHEYSHGLSTRLTGGSGNSDCLAYGEPGGLGEGWGDAIAIMIRTRTYHTRHTNMGIGGYVLNAATIRRYQYSTSLKTNPELFSHLGKPSYQEPHAAGAVWANILYEVYWNLVDKLGFNSDWVNIGDPKRSGNTLMLQLIIDGMKLQPCNPTFINARDAIIQAELAITKGANNCELWRGFAKRGMGIDAKSELGLIFTDSFDLPKYCY